MRVCWALLDVRRAEQPGEDVGVGVFDLWALYVLADPVSYLYIPCLIETPGRRRHHNNTVDPTQRSPLNYSPGQRSNS